MKWSPRFKWVIASEIIVIWIGATFVLPGGQDLQLYYLPLAKGCVECGFTPYFASWLLQPLSWIPEPLLWPLWTAITGLVIVYVCRQFGANPVPCLLTFPVLGLIWLGQIDAYLMLGSILAMYAVNPYARGLGLLLLAIKPQVAGPAILVLLWSERKRVKALVIPTVTFLATLIWWGFDWPLRWFAHQPALHVWRLATLFPVGLIAFIIVPLVEPGFQRVRATLLATALAMPLYGVYSYSVPLAMGAPWWSVPLSYAWALAYPWLGADSLRYAWILPLALLAHQLWIQRAMGSLRNWRDIVLLPRAKRQSVSSITRDGGS